MIEAKMPEERVHVLPHTMLPNPRIATMHRNHGGTMVERSLAFRPIGGPEKTLPEERHSMGRPRPIQGTAPHSAGWISCVAVVMMGLAMTAPTGAQQPSILESSGIGNVRIGLALEDAEQAIGVRFRSLVPGYGPGCWLAVRADGIEPGLSYMVEDGRITRIDVTTPSGGTVPAISTAKGIRIGSTQADVERNYGSSVMSVRAPYGHSDDDRWVTVETTPELGIVLSISGGRVVGLWAGRRQSIAYTEACS